jgi:deazaflavin-dependent oxidoreductase (nitroreductase family)
VAYFTPSPRALVWITRTHRALYRATNGIIGATLPQLEDRGHGTKLQMLTVLLLTTTGRKSGEQRTAPLPVFQYEGRTFLVGSFAGRHAQPAWYLNLLELPEVDVQLKSERRRCRAVTLRGEERARFWKMLTDEWQRYRLYQAGTSREIPLVELIDVSKDAPLGQRAGAARPLDRKRRSDGAAFRMALPC